MCSTSIKWLFINVSAVTSFIATCAIVSESLAQVSQPLRYEIPLSGNERHFEIVPAGNKGLYLQRYFATNKDNQVQLVRLDTAFQLKWGGFFPVDRNYVSIGRRAFEDKLFLLFRYKDYTRNDFILFVIDERDGNYTRYSIRGFIPFAQSEFQVTRESVLIGGYYNRVPVVLHYSLKDYRSKVLPGLFNEAGELTQIRTYDDGTFDVLISAMNFKKQRTIWIKNYDANGDLLRNFSLEADDNKHLIFGRSLKTSSDVQLIAGVYGASRSAEFSRGIFIASVDLSGFQEIKYYNFSDLQNFFKYMKAKREQRVKKRIERRKVKGKRIRFNYRFLVHELVPYENQFILLGEAFYPKYITVDRSYGSFFGASGRFPGGMIQNGRIFDGYYYTHAVVMGFSPQGKLLWDNSFEINDVRTFTLEQFVKLEVQEDKVALLYLYDNKLRTKIIKNNEVLEGKSIDPIETRFEDDIVKKNDSDVSKLEYWYNNYLYAYGIQEIENPAQGKARRRVFYINKVKHVE